MNARRLSFLLLPLLVAHFGFAAPSKPSPPEPPPGPDTPAQIGDENVEAEEEPASEATDVPPSDPGTPEPPATLPPAPTASAPASVPVDGDKAPVPLPTADSLVRVNSTNQPYNFFKPWAKRPPFTRRGIGVVLEGGRVLVTAELIADHTYVELERPGNSEKAPATVERVDYDSNLALLRPQDASFLVGANPIRLAERIQVGSKVSVVQLETTGALAFTPGVVTTVTVARYPADGVSLLVDRISAPLQYRENSFTMPVFDGNRLAGLLMRYEARSQSADVIPNPVIANFLARADRLPYRGFARAGIAFSPTRDPQFRSYLGMKPGEAGVYVVSVSHGGSAEKGGLKRGDVVLSVGGNPIDEDGNYESPEFGKIPFSYLISTANLPGGKLPVQVLREGKRIDLELPLEPRDPESIVSETAIIDRAPRYYILGGLVFQELSRSYLREWGADWRTNAPPRLAYLDEFQDELPPDQGKIVFLSEVLPGDTTLGYEETGTVVVKKVNGRPIRRLEDIAEAAKSPVKGYHEIELESDPGTLFLNAADAAGVADQLKETYGIPAMENLAPLTEKASR